MWRIIIGLKLPPRGISVLFYPILSYPITPHRPFLLNVTIYAYLKLVDTAARLWGDWDLSRSIPSRDQSPNHNLTPNLSVVWLSSFLFLFFSFYYEAWVYLSFLFLTWCGTVFVPSFSDMMWCGFHPLFFLWHGVVLYAFCLIICDRFVSLFVLLLICLPIFVLISVINILSSSFASFYFIFIFDILHYQIW